MITTNKDEWIQKNINDEDVALDHPLVDSFKHFYIGDGMTILVDGKPYTRITRALHDDHTSDVKHVNKDKDILCKIQKVRILKESDLSNIDIGHKIVYFRNVEI
jgi:hypothetical protein